MAIPPVQAQAPSHKELAFPPSMAPSPAELMLVKQRQEAAQNMQAAFTMVDKIDGYAPPPQVTQAQHAH